MISSFISAVRRRINYIQAFYGISDVSIKNLLSNCEILIKKLNKKKDKNIVENVEEESEEGKSIIQKKNQNHSSRNMTLINKEERAKKTKISLNNRIFLAFYILFMLVIFIYFPYNGYLLLNISQKSLYFSDFISKLSSFHGDVIDVFNTYREYLFDNQSSFAQKDLYEALVFKENEIFDKMNDNIIYISNFISQNIPLDEEMIIILSKHLCSYYITDYFNSPEECKQEFTPTLKYDFNIIVINFLQNLKNGKNIVKFRQETEIIIGNDKYDLGTNWSIPYIRENTTNKEISFRLNFFNDEILHSKINIMFLNIFFSYFNESRLPIIKRLLLEGKDITFIFNICLIIILFIK